ncbi:MAG TPA: aminotransferase class I/II-fold pyridoxal phosphate-dependent enzyme [Polyangia bacterium]|nr:aminotransferase class I/II-fold pyridoxal phosphate-dependent enzyme [Polyangia bacterium]
MNPLAKDLNTELQKPGCPAYSLLSRKGRSIFFPSKGILGQSAQARGKKINATIGTAFEEDGSALTLEILEGMVSLPSDAFLYAPSPGLQGLREEWKRMLVAKNPSLAAKTFSLPVVSSALTHGLSVCAYLFVDEGDNVILPDLYWDNYELIFSEAFGAELKTYNTFAGSSYDVPALAAALAQGEVGKRIVLLNFPNNPTGYTVTVAEAAAICGVLRRSAEAGNRIVVILDDAYFGLVYEDGISPESLFSALCDLHPNILGVKLDGPTKEDYVWSFRVGFITFGFAGATAEQLKALEAKAAGVVRASISNAPGISQSLLLKAYAHPEYGHQKRTKYDILRRRYLRIREILASHPEYMQSFEPMPFNSGYFMCLKLNGADPEEVRQELLRSFDTGVIVLAGLVRLAFSAVALRDLDALFGNLHEAVTKVRTGASANRERLGPSGRRA